MNVICAFWKLLSISWTLSTYTPLHWQCSSIGKTETFCDWRDADCISKSVILRMFVDDSYNTLRSEILHMVFMHIQVAILILVSVWQQGLNEYEGQLILTSWIHDVWPLSACNNVIVCMTYFWNWEISQNIFMKIHRIFKYRKL